MYLDNELLFETAHTQITFLVLAVGILLPTEFGWSAHFPNLPQVILKASFPPSLYPRLLKLSGVLSRESSLGNVVNEMRF